MKTQIVKTKLASLIHAHWNYKTDGTPEEIERLARAIESAGSCGVLAVREVNVDGEPMLEVMDGNHRLTAIRQLGWEDVPVENFGQISEAKAIILTRQRNQNWFEDDKLKLANLFVTHVFPEYSKEALELILPESAQSLEALELLANATWEAPNLSDDNGSSGSSNDLDFNKKKIFLKVSEEVFNLWEKWLERTEQITGLDSQERAFEFAVIEALNVPEEQLYQPKGDGK